MKIWLKNRGGIGLLIADLVVAITFGVVLFIGAVAATCVLCPQLIMQ